LNWVQAPADKLVKVTTALGRAEWKSSTEWRGVVLSQHPDSENRMKSQKKNREIIFLNGMVVVRQNPPQRQAF